MMLKYNDFLNESKMDDTFGTDPKKSLIFFSDTIRKDFESDGNKYQLFHDFYGDPDVFHGLSLVGREEIDQMRGFFRDCRYTWFKGGYSYTDTDLTGNKRLTYDDVDNMIHDSDRYYFYHIVKGNRREGAPDREHVTDIVKSGEKNWYIVITKRITCSLVKTKSRQEGGTWAEHKLVTLYPGWEESHHNIETIVMMNDVVIERSNGIIEKIFHSDDEVFTVQEDPETLVKYDILIDGEKRIEVKSYKNSEKDLWNAGEPKKIMLAEQFRMATRDRLIKIIEWYNLMFANDKRSREYRETVRLLNLDDRDIQKEFNIKIKEDGRLVDNPDRSEIADEIREFYNEKMEKVRNIFDGIEESKWMAGIYGIYFASGNRMDRRKDFLIKVDDDGERNFDFKWELKEKWCGFKELVLYMKVKGSAWEHILTEENNFVKVFQLEDYAAYERDRDTGEISSAYNGKVYEYNRAKNCWVESDND